MNKRNEVTIVIKDGLVQEAWSDNPLVTVSVVDLDTQDEGEQAAFESIMEGVRATKTQVL